MTDEGKIFDEKSTVLVVDDEELMREVVTMMVEDYGGKALTAVNGKDAVAVFEKNRDEIEYVFMDFSMPVMNGYEACVAMREIDPSVNIVIVSGLEVTPEVRELADGKKVEFLGKPFREDELMRAFKRIRDRNKS